MPSSSHHSSCSSSSSISQDQANEWVKLTYEMTIAILVLVSIIVLVMFIAFIYAWYHYGSFTKAGESLVKPKEMV